MLSCGCESAADADCASEMTLFPDFESDDLRADSPASLWVLALLVVIHFFWVALQSKYFLPPTMQTSLPVLLERLLFVESFSIF